MNKSWIPHGLWLVVAAAAFATGRYTVKPAGSSSAGGSSATTPASPPVIGDSQSKSQQGSKRALTEDNPLAWADAFRGRDGKISPEQIKVAMLEAVRDNDQARSMMRFSLLLKELTPENAPAAFKTIRETVTGFEAMRFLPMLNYAWGSIDGKSALEAMKDLGMTGPEGMFANATTLAGYASTDPEAARKWLDENHSEGPTRGILERAYVAGLARSDLAEATRYVESLPEDQRAGYIDLLIEQKIKDGITQSADWALSLSDPAMKTAALDRVAQQYARQDPATAANWVKLYASESYGKNAVATIAQEYANRAPADALRWAATLPNGESQNEAYSRIFQEWGRSDPTTASETLNSLPPGTSKDQAISSFTRTIARENPEDAIAWASTIGDSATREAAQIEVVQRWRFTDAEAANQWAAANLSPEAQAKASQWPRGRGVFGGFGGPPPGGLPPGLPPGGFR